MEVRYHGFGKEAGDKEQQNHPHICESIVLFTGIALGSEAGCSS